MKGSITIDFIFALVLGLGMSAILFAMSFSLSIIEITQYIAFATARAHSAAHISQDNQRDLAKKKYNELINNKVLAPFYKNGWFQVSSPQQIEMRGGSGTNTFNDEYQAENTFIGVRLDFESKILNLKIPFIGSSDSDAGYKAKITGFLHREPSTVECQRFFAERFNKIIEADTKGRYRTLSNIKADRYIPVEDNGC